MSPILCSTTDFQQPHMIQTFCNFDCVTINADLVGSEVHRNYNNELRRYKPFSDYDVRIPKLLKHFGVRSYDQEGLMTPTIFDHHADWDWYRYNFLLNIPGYHSRVVYQFKPLSGNTSYCRWSWVPSHWDEAGLQIVAEWHHRILEDDYDRFFQIGTVSRTDLALDFPGLNCDQLVLTATHVHPRKSKVYINRITNQRETLELGSSDSDTSHSFYNKSAQLVATKQPNLYPDFSNVPRYEMRRCFPHKKYIRVAALPNLVFPLERLQFYDFPLDRMPTNRALHFQIKLILRHGLQRILWHTDPKAAQHLLDQIAHYRIYPIDIGAAHCEFANQVWLKLAPFDVQLQPYLGFELAATLNLEDGLR